ncbi:MAG: hypothetical protein CMC70_05835 [Flavobacteriaceae bacterium]|jgi:hypothetical protein|nr:hypothetical protein [Flavobacteriaceae bacterium]
MSLRVREHLNIEGGVPTQQDAGVRDDVRDLLASMDITPPTEVVSEIQKKDNVISLSQGTYGGFSIEKEDTLVKSVATLTQVNRHIAITSDCVLDGITFINDEPLHSGVMVTVDATSTVLFRGCVFYRTSSDQVSSMVQFLSGGKAVFLGCLFKGTLANTTQVVANPGALANVQVVGSYNKTGGALGQATLTAVLS